MSRHGGSWSFRIWRKQRRVYSKWRQDQGDKKVEDLEKKAVRRIQIASEMSQWHYGLPLVCAYSGGKDSDVMLELFRRSGIPFEVQNSHTKADAPQTVYHIRNVFKNLELQGIKCGIDYHKMPGSRKAVTMWNLIPHKLMPPTRIMRYCCSVLKESYGNRRFIATGVRWDESSRRKTWGNFSDPKNRLNVSDEIMLMNDNDEKRLVVESCIKKNIIKKECSKLRSKTFTGIARAMAKQWG